MNFADESGDDDRVGREAHEYENHALLANGVRGERLGLLVKVEHTAFEPTPHTPTPYYLMLSTTSTQPPRA
jgi:hypothetical protein